MNNDGKSEIMVREKKKKESRIKNNKGKKWNIIIVKDKKIISEIEKK